MRGLAEFKKEFEGDMMFAAFQAAYPRRRPCHSGIGRGFRRCWNPTVMGGIIRCSEHGGWEALRAVVRENTARSGG